MVSKRFKKKSTAVRYAKKHRKMGYVCSIYKMKNGYGVSSTRKRRWLILPLTTEILSAKERAKIKAEINAKRGKLFMKKSGLIIKEKKSLRIKIKEAKINYAKAKKRMEGMSKKLENIDKKYNKPSKKKKGKKQPDMYSEFKWWFYDRNV